MIIEFEGKPPQIAASAFVAPTAVVIGDVRLGEGASVWFGAVLRGDEGTISIGDRSSIQDNVVVHCGPGMPTIIGDDVTVGHGAILEGCTVGEGALIGMGAIVLNWANVGARSIVAAGAVVRERAEIGATMLAAGVPAREKRQLDQRGLYILDVAPGEYQRLVARYRGGAVQQVASAPTTHQSEDQT